MQSWAALPHDGFAALRDALERGFALSGNRGFSRTLRAVRATEMHLRRPLRIAVMGEQNAGKSSLINMMLRASVVPAGALSGARAHLLLRYGQDAAVYAIGADGARARLTSKALAKMGTPETPQAAPRTNIIYNASDRTHTPSRADLRGLGLLYGAMPPSDSAAKLIELALPYAFLQAAELVESRLYPQTAEKIVLRRAFRPMDLAIWCTLATQAWKETERQAWRRFPGSLSRNAILLVTYRDAVNGSKDEARLVSRLERDAGPLFGDIILLSLRKAVEALSPDGGIADAAKWEKSGAAEFEAVLDARLKALRRRRLAKSAALLGRLGVQIVETSGTVAPEPSADTMAMHFGRLIRDIEQRLAQDSGI